MSRQLNRREMLRHAVAVGAGTWLAGRGSAKAKAVSPNQKLSIAIVGCGGRGGANLEGVKSENIVALCDVDEQRVAGAVGRPIPQGQTISRLPQDVRRACTSRSTRSWSARPTTCTPRSA